MPRGPQVKRDGLVITVGWRDTSSGITLKNQSHPQLPVQPKKDHIGEELEKRLSSKAQVPGVGLSGQMGLKVPQGSPHKLTS